MDNITKAFEALGKALANKDAEINILRWENEEMEKRIEELEAKDKFKIETNIKTTIERRE